MAVLKAVPGHLSDYRRIDMRDSTVLTSVHGMKIDGGSQYSGCFRSGAGVGVGEGVEATCA